MEENETVVESGLSSLLWWILPLILLTLAVGAFLYFQPSDNNNTSVSLSSNKNEAEPIPPAPGEPPEVEESEVPSLTEQAPESEVDAQPTKEMPEANQAEQVSQEEMPPEEATEDSLAENASDEMMAEEEGAEDQEASEPEETVEDGTQGEAAQEPVEVATDLKMQAEIEQEPDQYKQRPSLFGIETLERPHLTENEKSPFVVLQSTKENTPDDQWRTILIKNQRKFDYTVMPFSNRQFQLVSLDNKIKVAFENESSSEKDILARKKRGKFAVQMMSLDGNRFNRAVEIVRMLVHDGYYAYIYRTHEQFQNQYWYRIRIGYFKTAEEAHNMGQEIFHRYQDKKLFPNDFWTVAPSRLELSREIIDLRTKLNKPWIIQLPLYESREQATADIPEFSTGEDVIMLAQKQEGDKLVYRMRVGFFETKAQAQQHVNKLRKKRAEASKSTIMKL